MPVLHIQVIFQAIWIFVVKYLCDVTYSYAFLKTLHQILVTINFKYIKYKKFNEKLLYNLKQEKMY